MVCAVGIVVAMGAIEVWRRYPAVVRQTLHEFRFHIASSVALGGVVVIVAVAALGVGAFLPTQASLGIRLQQYTAALEMARDYPLFGVGGGNVQILSTNYGLERAHSTHNVFLRCSPRPACSDS